jgi:hypothetical protein
MTTSFDKVFRRYRRDAVLLHPPYPPHAGRPTNSKFGGLPNLPAHYDWPRTPNGTPLHFLAQIDCADIGFPTPLPERGVLFFFGRDDIEQNWRNDDPARNCRVIYALDAFAATAPREVPADLESIRGPYRTDAWREFLLERESGPNVHVEWPIEPLPIDSWPCVPPDAPSPLASSFAAAARHVLGLKSGPQRVTWQKAEAERRRYKEQHDQLRANAFTSVTGERSEYDPNDHDHDQRAARAVFFHADEGPDAYPQYWITIHYAARAVLRRPGRMISGADGDPELRKAQVISTAEEWLRRPNEIGPDAPVSEEDRSAFRAWLTSGPSRFENSPRFPPDVIVLSLVATIRSWAGNPRRAALLPPHVYEIMRVHLSVFVYGVVHFSQMFGHAPSVQEPLHPDDPTVCLLNLESDHTLAWSFGGAGNCTFWITPEDLTRRDFSKVWGTIVRD